MIRGDIRNVCSFGRRRRPTITARCGTRSNGLWSDTVARAERLLEPARHERVDDEWSFVETLRHLVFVTDAWASRTILDQPMPYHRLGLTQTSCPPADAAALGIDLDACPSFAEVMQVRADRMALVRAPPLRDARPHGPGRALEPSSTVLEQKRPVYLVVFSKD